MTQTIENLKTAFAGESQANRRYLAFAKKADAEGYPQVAKLFRAAAHAETVHALNHLNALGEVATTADNLRAAMAGENYESTSMYPEMVTAAEAEGDQRALRSFRWALAVEKVHEDLFGHALDGLGHDKGTDDYYVCPFCGYTHYGSAPEKCPVCGAAGAKFERIG